MKTRINYIKTGKVLKAQVFNYIAQTVFIEIDENFNVKIYNPDDKFTEFQCSSLQIAKRKVRKVLTEEFKVRLKSEVRKKCVI